MKKLNKDIQKAIKDAKATDGLIEAITTYVLKTSIYEKRVHDLKTDKETREDLIKKMSDTFSSLNDVFRHSNESICEHGEDGEEISEKEQRIVEQSIVTLIKRIIDYTDIFHQIIPKDRRGKFTLNLSHGLLDDTYIESYK